MPLTRSETLRKLTHIGFGFCAVLMAWLTTWQTAAVALAALLFNWLVLPHAGGKLITRDGRGNDAGILLYPFAVLVLVLAFPSRPEIAAAVWAFLAFGDGSATLAGKAFGGPRIPWNRDKSLSGSLAFLVVGGAADTRFMHFSRTTRRRCRARSSCSFLSFSRLSSRRFHSMSTTTSPCR
ncbi:MAG: hypothetical protein ACYC9N_08325 [Thermoanaerobaculia bacterium]